MKEIFRMERDPDSAAARESPLPLEHTEVTARITGSVVTVEVEQRFRNPFPDPIEVRYLFPLPHEAVITGFEMRSGGRTIRGAVKGREEAQRLYWEAREEGRRAGLLEQERPNLFTVSVAGILPGEGVTARLTYEERVGYDSGICRFVFPTVVTPRYVPAGVGDAARLTAPLAGEGEQVGDFSVTVEMEAGAPLADITSPSHRLAVARQGEGRAVVRLADGAAVPNKDFVLEYKVGSGDLRPALWLHREGEGSCIFLLQILPGGLPELPQAEPREVVFVLDRSGSMGGTPIVQARRALKACLRGLDSGDTFDIILFDDEVEVLSPQPVPFSQRHLDEADRFLDLCDARGGTEMLPALEAALALPRDRSRQRILVFLTDGAVGNEEGILRHVERHGDDARIFGFGIGPAVNRYLVSRLAEIGRGCAEFLLGDENIEHAVTRFQARLGRPLLRDLVLRCRGGRFLDVYPNPLPDLYPGVPLAVVGRVEGRGRVRLTVDGRTAEGEWRHEEEVEMGRAEALRPELGRIWARERIERLESGLAGRHWEEAVRLALDHGLLTRHTAFIALEEQAGLSGPPRPVRISLPLPEGLEPELLYSPAVSLDPADVGVYCLSSLPCLDLVSAPVSVRRRGYRTNAMAPAFPERSPSGPLEEALAALARVQGAGGAWGDGGEDGLEPTAAAVIAFVRAGHTPVAGSYPGQVGRAVRWLSQAVKAESFPGGGSGGAEAEEAWLGSVMAAWALAEVAARTRLKPVRQAAGRAWRLLRRTLPAGGPVPVFFEAAVEAARRAGIAVPEAAERGRTAMRSRKGAALPVSVRSSEDLRALAAAVLAGDGKGVEDLIVRLQAGDHENDAGMIRIGGAPSTAATAWGALVLALGRTR